VVEWADPDDGRPGREIGAYERGAAADGDRRDLNAARHGLLHRDVHAHGELPGGYALARRHDERLAVDREREVRSGGNARSGDLADVEPGSRNLLVRERGRVVDWPDPDHARARREIG